MKKLTPEEENIIIKKGTEPPFSGKYNNFYKEGIFVCRRCENPLYDSTAKFKSGCGWPSFDDEFPGAVKHIPDADGIRTEIICAKCEAHLGHIFHGEHYTPKDTRHCVNSLSIKFIPKEIKTAFFASGCFWGTQYYFNKIDGVVSTTAGYIGGNVENPTYEQVSSGTTGHVEAVKVEYDSGKISYEELVKMFFETHDPTQKSGQGPDIGSQYQSKIFYGNQSEKEIAEKLIKILEGKGMNIATQLEPASTFYPAEEYHQNYYGKSSKNPYCHIYRKLF